MLIEGIGHPPKQQRDRSCSVFNPERSGTSEERLEPLPILFQMLKHEDALRYARHNEPDNRDDGL